MVYEHRFFQWTDLFIFFEISILPCSLHGTNGDAQWFQNFVHLIQLKTEIDIVFEAHVRFVENGNILYYVQDDVLHHLNPQPNPQYCYKCRNNIYLNISKPFQARLYRKEEGLKDSVTETFKSVHKYFTKGES